MRVMLVSNIFPPHVRGGYELGMLDVARAFVSAGHEVEVVTSRTAGMLRKVRPVRDVEVREVFAPVLAYESELHGRLDGSVSWHRYRTEALGGIDMANVVALELEIRRFAPDRIWLGNPLGIGPIGVFEAALSAGVPVIVHLMDDIDRYLVGYRRPVSWLARMRRLKRSLTAVSCSALTRSVNSEIGEYSTHFVIPNGFDFDSLPSQARPGQHDGPLRFVYFGQVEPAKGLSQLVEGLGVLMARPDPPAIEVDVIGPASASYTGTLQGEISARGLDRCVRLLGRMEKATLMARLSAYDGAVLLLKAEEPFGFALIEAVAAGLPLVATRVGAGAEVFPERYPLFVEDRNDPVAVANAIGWCVTHRSELAEFAGALRRHVAERCDATTVINPQYEAVLQTARPPRTRTHIDTLLASTMTADTFAMSQDGFR